MNRALLALVAVLAITGQALSARLLKQTNYAGTPDELAAYDPDLKDVMRVIKGLGVLPDGMIDSGITITAPTNDGVQKLLRSLSLSLPADDSGLSAFLDKLGPIKNILVSAILYNISPGTPAMPSAGDTVTLNTANGNTAEIDADADGKLTVSSPGNPTPANVVDVFNWNGAQIVKVDQVLQPAALTAIKPITVEDGMAAIAAFRSSLPGDMAGSPDGAPAPAPGMDMEMGMEDGSSDTTEN